jgi:hypothetical protein
LHEVRAHRWVPYTSDGFLETRAEIDGADPLQVRAALLYRCGDMTCDSSPASLVFEGIAQFAERRCEPTPAAPLELAGARPSKFTADRLYREQWLFHGPPMQALTEVGPVSLAGITGRITVRPLDPLLRSGESINFQTDPIALDTFTHLLGCWGLDCLEQGDVIFPLAMGRLTIHGETPKVGTEIDCRINVHAIEHHRVCVSAELVFPDGLVWMRIHDWKDWRFYWPARYRDVFRAPDTILIGEKLTLPGIEDSEAIVVWLAPPSDMARPVWRDVLEQTQLGPEERSELLAEEDTEADRTQRLWGRIAAKEAARRLWLAAGLPARFPNDLSIDDRSGGRAILRDLARVEATDLPALSIAHAEGIALALAARNPGTRLGTGIEPIREPSVESDLAGFTPEELSLIPAQSGSSRAEWLARFRAARQAAVRASASGNEAERDSQVKSVDPVSEDVTVVLRAVRAPSGAEPPRQAILVHTALRANHAWSWTLGAEVQEP